MFIVQFITVHSKLMNVLIFRSDILEWVGDTKNNAAEVIHDYIEEEFLAEEKQDL